MKLWIYKTLKFELKLKKNLKNDAKINIITTKLRSYNNFYDENVHKY